MLLSDRDIKAEIDSDRVRLEPYDPGMIQPSSIDVRLDKFFRLFDNHKYPVFDPSQDQPDLTRLVEVEPPLLDELHDKRRPDRLGLRRDVIDRVRRGGDAVLDIGVAESSGPHDLLILDDGGGQAGNPELRANCLDLALELRQS